jgi:hypothetical protein
MKFIWELIPYTGFYPFLFKMDSERVEEVWPNSPLDEYKGKRGDTVQVFKSYALTFSAETGLLLSIELPAHFPLRYKLFDLFADRSATLEFLAKEDPPVLFAGSLLCLEMGIRLVGFHDDQPAKITGFSKPLRDVVWERRSRFRPFSLSDVDSQS